MIYNKICDLCGELFITKHNQERYCKKEHYVKCIICGKSILLKNSTDKANYLKKGFKTCSQKCAKIHMKQTNLKKYGYSSILNTPEIKAKTAKILSSVETRKKISKGVSKARKRISEEQYKSIYEKTKQTNLKKYGVECTLQLPKSRETMIKKYGAEYTGNSPILIKKMKQTNLKKYGVEFPFQNNEISNKAKLTMKNKPLQEKKFIKNKQKETYKQKTGFEYYSQTHLNKETLNIIHNDTLFYNYIMNIPYKNRCIKEISDSLGISFSHCSKLIKKLIQKYSQCKINYFTSSFEIEVENFISTLNINYITKDRKIITPYELDIYIPDYKLAIECNGTYYHSSKINTNKNYHYNKSKLCEEKGIRLIHIYEYEWNDERQRPILENIIKNALGINEHKIYARKCNIIIKESKEMKDFFNKNNIQGFRGGSFSICLSDKETNEIYMAYMFGKAFFGKGKYEWEVIRGATKLGYNIIGGASKIWKYFITNYNPKSIVYYIDYNYFNGNSLPYLGLKYIKTQPSFKNYFVKEKIIKNRDPIHHKEIVKGYENGSILQIWNAGTKVYVWENN